MSSRKGSIGRKRRYPLSGTKSTRDGPKKKMTNQPSLGLDHSRVGRDRTVRRLEARMRSLDDERHGLETKMRQCVEKRLPVGENQASTKTGERPLTIALDSPSPPKPRSPPAILRQRSRPSTDLQARSTTSACETANAQCQTDGYAWVGSGVDCAAQTVEQTVIDEVLRIRKRQQRVKRTQTPVSWREKKIALRSDVDEANGDCEDDEQQENNNVDEHFDALHLDDEDAISSPVVETKHRWGAGNRLCGKVEALVRCVHNNLKVEYGDRAAIRAAKLTDLHVTTVRRIVNRAPELTPSILPHCRVVTRRKKSDIWAAAAAKIDGVVQDKIREMVHGFYRKTERVTVEKLHLQLKESFASDDELRKQLDVSTTQFRNALHGLDYKFGTIRDRSFVFNKPDIVAWLHRFLRTMRDLRSRGDCLFFFCDETWAFEQMSAKRTWLDPLSSRDPEKALQRGYTTGPSKPPNRGKRCIILHCISEFGPLKGAERVWISQTRTGDGDYHKCMNGDLFEEWLQSACRLMQLEGIKRGYRRVVLVMDNARYHTRYVTKVPPTGTKKSVVANFLNSLRIEASEEESAKELHAKIKQLNASRINTLAAEEIAKEYGVQIVRLPPYMCEFNPIESFWAWVKHRLEDRISPTDKIVEVRDKCLQLFDEVPEAICRNFVAHCKRLEQEAAEKAGLHQAAAAVQNLGQFGLEEEEEELEEDEEDGDDEVEQFDDDFDREF